MLRVFTILHIHIHFTRTHVVLSPSYRKFSTNRGGFTLVMANPLLACIAMPKIQKLGSVKDFTDLNRYFMVKDVIQGTYLPLLG